MLPDIDIKAHRLKNIVQAAGTEAATSFVALSIQILIIIDLVKYSLKLKYARKYDLIDLLPSAPDEGLKPY